MAAKNHGIKEVLIPVQNKKDISELSEEILGGMQITYVSDMQEVLERAIIQKGSSV